MSPPSIPNFDRDHRRQAIRAWLGVVALLIVFMVMLGGITRLTDSGLSIVEWKPVTGAIPPLGEEQWQAEFHKYAQIPQYRQLNLGMSLAEFKTIYWWEWSHRQFGRLIGIVFLLPMLVFWWRGWLEPWLKPRLIALLVFGASQGVIGWWMVASGLSERTDVSQIRLAIHFTLACAIFSATLWVMRGLAPTRQRDLLPASSRWIAYGLLALTLAQLFLGALVAGLNAGLTYNTWPLMDGRFIPPAVALYPLAPAWINHFETIATVQFQHRIMAYIIVGLAIWHAVALSRRGVGSASRRAIAIAGIALTQAVIGIAALLFVVPLWSALLHQAWAVVLLAMVTVHAYAARRDASNAVNNWNPLIGADQHPIRDSHIPEPRP